MMSESSGDVGMDGTRRSMRDEIKSVASRLLTLRGYRGVSYGEIARELEITTTNIHYHFGPKAQLVAAVLADYIEQVSGRYRGIWTAQTSSLMRKVEDTIVFNREAYTRLNPQGKEGNSWSLITRLSAEGEALDHVMRERIVAFRRDIQTSAVTGIEISVRNGELRGETPCNEIGRLMASCFLYAVHITRDSGGFRGLSQHYATQLDLIERSWGGVGGAVRHSKLRLIDR